MFLKVWHFPETSIYNKDKKKHGLWSEYIDYFLRMKQEASGYPLGVVTEEQKDAYIAYYEKHEGIKLRKDRIVYNEVLRQLAKIQLKSLWVSNFKFLII